MCECGFKNHTPFFSNCEPSPSLVRSGLLTSRAAFLGTAVPKRVRGIPAFLFFSRRKQEKELLRSLACTVQYKKRLLKNDTLWEAIRE